MLFLDQKKNDRSVLVQERIARLHAAALRVSAQSGGRAPVRLN